MSAKYYLQMQDFVVTLHQIKIRILFESSKPCPGFSASGGSSSRICVSYIAARFSNFSRGPIFGLYILIDRK